MHGVGPLVASVDAVDVHHLLVHAEVFVVALGGALLRRSRVLADLVGGGSARPAAVVVVALAMRAGVAGRGVLALLVHAVAIVAVGRLRMER